MDEVERSERLKIAFAWRVASMIAEADKDLSAAEMLLLTEAFPRELLDGLGFVDAEGQFTDAYHQAVLEALEDLPEMLPEDEKLGLVTLFARVVYADGVLHAREAMLLIEAGEYLGLSKERLRDHLRPLLERE